MYAGKVEICGVNTAQLPVLSEAEKARLLRAAAAGDENARQQMIQGNLRLVLSVVQKFAGRGENMDDLFQVGCIGLIKAIDNFDSGLNVRFSTCRPERPCKNKTAASRASARSLKASVPRPKMSPWRWNRWPNRPAFTNLCTVMGKTLFPSWTRYTTKMVKKAGSAPSCSRIPCML